MLRTISMKVFMTTLQTYRPVGQLDGSNATGHEQELLALLSQGAHSVNIDLSGLDYVSSAGLRVFLVVAKAAKSKGGKVVLLSPKAGVMEVIKMSGFHRVLEVQT